MSHPDGFALYPWWVEHGTELVHPNDLIAFRDSVPAGRVFRYARDGDWIVLSAEGRGYRVRDKLLQPIAAPKYWEGDMVEFIKGGVRERGVVRRLGWHFAQREPIYFLSLRGKMLKKQYFECDFIEGASE